MTYPDIPGSLDTDPGDYPSPYPVDPHEWHADQTDYDTWDGDSRDGDLFDDDEYE